MHLFDALSPLSFLDRAARFHSGRTAVIDGDLRLTYAELHERCRRLAGSLSELATGAPVAVLAPNIHVALEAHFAVPWSGSPLVMINTRLAAPEVRSILEHSGASVLLTDPSLLDLARSATQAMTHPPFTVAGGPGDDGTYERMVTQGEPGIFALTDEHALLSINYTSGTTGEPKGAMYHHRGAYLQALAMVAHMRMDPSSSYLWTLPMFHCNGWCFPWAVTAAAATHVCLPKVDPAAIWDLVDKAEITHMCGAPAVLTGMLESAAAQTGRRGGPLHFLTGGAAPSPSMLAAAEAADVEVTQAYGLTETHGPAVLCVPDPAWKTLDRLERARMQARRGIPTYAGLRVRVVAADGVDVPTDGESMGEVWLRGNTLMLGYFKDDTATASAMSKGWFRTGDIAVLHPDGHLELRDRKKDVIISGGENITSIEVEQAIASHPAVLEVAVVGIPDQRWGEVPIAHVQLRDHHVATELDIIEHVRELLARFKTPKRVVFGSLPRTATGKIQKFALREAHRAEAAAPDR